MRFAYLYVKRHAISANQIAAFHLANQDTRAFVTYTHTAARHGLNTHTPQKSVSFQYIFLPSKSAFGHRDILVLGDRDMSEELVVKETLFLQAALQLGIQKVLKDIGCSSRNPLSHISVPPNQNSTMANDAW